MAGTTLTPDDPIARLTIMDVYEKVKQISAQTHKESGRFIVQCPGYDHPDKHPSCALNPNGDVWKCFSCNRKGGKLQMVIEAGFAKTTHEARMWLLGESQGFTKTKYASNSSQKKWPAQPPMKINQVRGSKEKLDDERLVGTYPYRDERGKVLYEVLRYEGKSKNGGRGKRFSQRSPVPGGTWKYSVKGVRQVLYRLPELIEANKNERAILVTEGEKHADALAYLGFNVTTNMNGWGWEWDPSWKRFFNRSKMIFILGDSDEAGRKAIETRLKFLEKTERKVIAVDFFPKCNNGEDILDWMQQEKLIKNLKDIYSVETPLQWQKLFTIEPDVARKYIEKKLASYVKK